MKAQFVVIICTFLASLSVALSIFNEKRKLVWYSMTLLFAFSILIAALYVENGEDAYKEARIAFESEMKLKNQQIAERNEEIARISKELVRKSEQLAKKTDEMGKLNKELAAITTEGDSFCYLVFFVQPRASKKAVVFLHHKGNYPLYDVFVVITNYGEFRFDAPQPKKLVFKPLIFAELMKLGTAIPVEVGTVSPPGVTVRLIDDWELPNRKEVEYRIDIYSRFQRFYQTVKLQQVDGRWRQTYRVLKYAANQKDVVLLEVIPDGFPREEK